MRYANETYATRLCEALTGIGLQLKRSECVEVLSKLTPDSANNSRNINSSEDQHRAEQFVDELFDGMFEPDYTKFTQLFEEKFLIHIPEVEFQKNMQEERERLVPTLAGSLWARWQVPSAQVMIVTPIWFVISGAASLRKTRHFSVSVFMKNTALTTSVACISSNKTRLGE